MQGIPLPPARAKRLFGYNRGAVAYDAGLDVRAVKCILNKQYDNALSEDGRLCLYVPPRTGAEKLVKQKECFLLVCGVASHTYVAGWYVRWKSPSRVGMLTQAQVLLRRRRRGQGHAPPPAARLHIKGRGGNG